jgi:uncharacterized membrane protein YdbT with pleckstrin-like domain
MILIGDLIILELFLIMFYLLFRLPFTYFFSGLSSFELENLGNLFGVLYYILLSLIELFLILLVTLRWTSEEYEIRNDTIVHRIGILKTMEETYSLRNLGNAAISQGVLGKIFNFGTIRIFSPLLKQEYFINNVHNPKQILESLEDDLSDRKNKGTIIRRV